MGEPVNLAETIKTFRDLLSRLDFRAFPYVYIKVSTPLFAALSELDDFQAVDDLLLHNGILIAPLDDASAAYWSVGDFRNVQKEATQ